MNKIIGQPQFLKEMNAEQIERMIYESGPISKPELSKRTGLSLPTVNKLVTVLEKTGSVKSIGLMGTGAGRKANVYVANDQSGCMAIIYYHEEKYISRLVNMAGDVLYSDEVPCTKDRSSLKEVLGQMEVCIRNLKEHATSDMKAIGIGVPGAVGRDDILSAIPSLPCLEGFNLKRHIEGIFEVSTFIENDVKLTTLGYYHKYLKKKYSDVVYIFYGQGLGCGIIVQKRLLKGMSNFAGEVGLIPLPVKGMDSGVMGFEGNLEHQLAELKDHHGDEAFTSQMAFLAGTLICTLNPEMVVMGGRFLPESVVNAVEKKVNAMVPKGHCPRFIRDDDGRAGVDGAINLCIANISSSFTIVREKGV